MPFPCREIADSVRVPARKRRLHFADVLALFLSVICFALAMLAVANNDISWRLGIKTYQLIVVGFLLSIMNPCLGTVAPTLFLLLEARYGASTLQNFDGLLRQQLLRPQLGAMWRIVLFCAMALPLGLSAAYKSFTGGQSYRTVLPSSYIGNETWYGMFGPPGLQSLGLGSGYLFSLMPRCHSFSQHHPQAMAQSPLCPQPLTHMDSTYCYWVTIARRRLIPLSRVISRVYRTSLLPENLGISRPR